MRGGSNGRDHGASLLGTVSSRGAAAAAEVPGESGIHSTKPLRTIDYTILGFKREQAEKVCEEGNEAWEYDERRPGRFRVFVPHEVVIDGKTLGWHIHMQVHNGTINKKGNGRWKFNTGV